MTFAFCITASAMNSASAVWTGSQALSAAISGRMFVASVLGIGAGVNVLVAMWMAGEAKATLAGRA